MSSEDSKIPPATEAAQASQDLAELASQAQQMFTEFITNNSQQLPPEMDPLNLSESLAQAGQKLWMDPGKLMRANMQLWMQHMQLWQNISQQMMGQKTEAVVEPEKGDRRFKDTDWDTNPFFDFIKQSYLITSRWLTDTMSDLEGLDNDTAHKVSFYTKQFADAFSPSNFLLTNPEVLRATIESNGENLRKGLENFLQDFDVTDGSLQMRMTPPDAFELGKNIATTPGKILYQNDLMQLIQYTPTTEQVYTRPLLIVPPWINKFYILDLTEKKSFIKWTLDQGYTVFVVSWVNPDESHAEKTFEDYMLEGIIDAVEEVKKATGEPDMTTIGYCVGGTLLAVALAHLAAKGDQSIKAATFLAAQVDFSEAGDLKVFIDEQQLQGLDAMMEEKGYLEGQAMFSTFNMLRANDLIWSFYVNNYLLGKDPMPFDLLHWNSDTTRMPRLNHMFYLRQMYLHNNLVKPGAIELGGTPIDLTKIDIPIYLQASREDHIAPYHSVFKAVGHYTGPVRAILAGSGHIAGVINPPAQNKYQYWTNEELPYEADKWLANAEEHKGSWWPDWSEWMARLSGPKVPARVPGDRDLAVMEDAPGSYVKG